MAAAHAYRSLAHRVRELSLPTNIDSDGWLRKGMSYELNRDIEQVLSPEDVDNRARQSYYRGGAHSLPEPDYGSDIGKVMSEARKLRSESFPPRPQDGGWIFSLDSLADFTYRATMKRLNRNGDPLSLKEVTTIGKTAELALLESVLLARAAAAELVE
jgi:hypothetical protein